MPAPGETVELRVHGVGGATPEELLDVPLTERVAGDPAAGFFRPWFDPAQPGGRRALEGYSWGGLTSASRLRALWVLLSPFAVANLAGWMVRHGGEATDTEPRQRDRLESLAVALIRVFCVVLTVAFVGYVTVGAVDLLAFQCGAHPTCGDGRWWMSPWENGVVGGHTGRVLVVGALVAVAVALGMAWLARRSQQAIHDRRRVDYAGTGDPAFSLNLHHWRLWTSPHVAHRLGLSHTAAAISTVGLTLASVAGQLAIVQGEVLMAAGWTLLCLSGLVTVRLERIPARVHMILAAMAGVHLAVTMALVWFGRDVAAWPGPAPGGRVVPGFLLPVYPALALLVGGVVLALWRRQHETSLRIALVAPALLLLSSGMVNAFGSGLLIRLADLLGTPVAASSYPTAMAMPQPPIVYADVISDTAVVTVVTLVVLVATVAVVWLRAGTGPGCRALKERYADRGGLDCDDPDDQEWARRVGRAEVVASLTDEAALIVGTVALVVVGLTAAAVVFTGDPAGMGLGDWADRLAGPASVVLGLIPAAAIYGISRLYSSVSVRRVVGIVWDVATFWPRWFHPWSPPAYGERAVPQLGDRLSILTESGGVVISAHSQGSVLAMATMLVAEPEVVSRTALLTHGSPLTRLYAHYFPEYCTPGLYTVIAGRVQGWINLWRPTDYIGGQMAAPGIEDRQVFDPPSTQPPALGEARPRPARHSDYDRTDEYRTALADLNLPPSAQI